MNNPPGHDEQQDHRFEEALRDLLRRSEGEIDFVSASRLRAARAQALDASRTSARVHSGWWTVPGALMSAVLLAWLLIPGRVRSPATGGAAAVPQVEVIETLADDKTNGVYDDLEFYQWLAETDSHG
jgi:hypothetical protein